MPQGYQTQHFSAKQAYEGKNQYNEEDGFMRGARIAEKIQEFYNTTGPVPSTNTGFTSGSQTLQANNEDAKAINSNTAKIVSNATNRNLVSQGGQRQHKVNLIGD